MRKYILHKLDLISLSIYNKNYLDIPIEYRSVLKSKIRLLKMEFKNNLSSDPLHDKMIRYGNSGAWGKLKLQELRQRLFRDKKPPNDTIYCAVEIECIFNGGYDYNNFIKDIRNNSLSNCVTIKNDGSLRNSDDCSCNDESCNTCYDARDYIPKEIVVFFPKNDMTVLKKVCEYLDDRAHVNKSCGLHVHFDYRDKGKTLAFKAANKLAHIVPLLKLMLPEGRRNNSFCSEIISKDRGSRYAFVNTTAFSKHQTIEVRGHSGTTSFEKISQWIMICDAAMNHKKLPDNSTFGEMLYSLDLSKETYDYAMRRLKKFSPNYLDQFKSMPNTVQVENNNNETIPVST